MTILLVDPDKPGRLAAKRQLTTLHHRLLEANDGKEALAILERENVDLVLANWTMPNLDGPGLCEAIKQDERYRQIHCILMTEAEHPCQVTEECGRGADDFLRKAVFDQELISRVRAGLRARQLINELAEFKRLLSQKQAEWNGELLSASEFVQTLLPQPGTWVPGMRLDWKFLPSSHLGGDLFQVAQWGEDHVGLMVLDMSGHGIGAALRAVSLAMFFQGEHIQNMFPDYEPGEMVTFLNRKHPMTDDGEYFTIWIGVWQCSTNLLRYASAGHPGSILVQSNTASLVLGKPSWPIGFLRDHIYSSEITRMHTGNRLYLYSDGIYEVMNADGGIWGRPRFQQTLEHIAHLSLSPGLDEVIERSRAWNHHQKFGDDVALLGVEFQ